MVDATLSEDVIYACVFFIDHVCGIDTDFAPIAVLLDKFLGRHLLHFEETKRTHSASTQAFGLDRSEYLTPINFYVIHVFCLRQTNCPGKSALLKLVRDACRFAQTFAKSFEDHPLLVYFAALPFAPTNSIIYQKFHDKELALPVHFWWLPDVLFTPTADIGRAYTVREFGRVLTR